LYVHLRYDIYRINEEELIMFKIEENNQKVGAYLKKLIEKKYDSHRKFCRAYIEAQGLEVTDEKLRKMGNRISQIIKGAKAIQTYDLPFFTDLLGVSCEEILSAGKTFVLTSGHVTNYEIAYSHDRAVWERYMHHKDNLFMNFDEYGKSVIDYAFEFKNYEFIKYLLDEKYIWLVDNSQWQGFTYGAGTSIKRREIGYIDSSTPLQIQYEDRLRTQTIALAIENDDLTVLDSLLARENPALYYANYTGYPKVDLEKYRNDDLIETIANGDETVLSYFSEPFETSNLKAPKWRRNTFLFPYLGDVIDVMLKNGRKESEVLIRRAIRHNKETYTKLKDILKEGYKNAINNYGFEVSEEMKSEVWKRTVFDFKFDENTRMISYYYCRGKHDTVGMITNIIKVTTKPTNLLLSELVNELNDWFEKTVNLKEGLD